MKTTVSILLFLAVAVTADQLAMQQEEELSGWDVPRDWIPDGYYRYNQDACGSKDAGYRRLYWGQCISHCSHNSWCEGVHFGAWKHIDCYLLTGMKKGPKCWSSEGKPASSAFRTYIKQSITHTRKPTRSPTRHWNAEAEKDEVGGGYAIGATDWKIKLPELCKAYTDRQAIRHCIQGHVHLTRSLTLKDKIKKLKEGLKKLTIQADQQQEKLKMAENDYSYNSRKAIHWKLAAEDQKRFAKYKKQLAKDEVAYQVAKSNLAQAKTAHEKVVAQKDKAAKELKVYQAKLRTLIAKGKELEAESATVTDVVKKRKKQYDESVTQSKKLNKQIKKNSDDVKKYKSKVIRSTKDHKAAMSQIKKVDIQTHKRNEEKAKKKLANSKEHTKNKKKSAHASHELARLYDKKKHKAKQAKTKGKDDKKAKF